MKLILVQTMLLLLALTGCDIEGNLDHLGKPPSFTPIPRTSRSPLDTRPESYQYKESDQATPHHQTLWRTGKRSFFRDQRAQRVGDILTVLVEIKGEKGELKSTSSRDRTNKTNVSMASVFGGSSPGILGAAAGGPMLDYSSQPSYRGTGSVKRKEDVTVKISVVVKEILPNGNLVIEGRQEVRLNFEIREIYVSGIVRPQDISYKNVVTWDRIAEARIGYGGRGQITQFQQPPYGTQVLDMLMPI